MDLATLVKKIHYAISEGGTGSLSTGEAVAVALVLNRPDWLKAQGYTLAEAIELIHGEGWIDAIPQAARALRG